MSVADDYAHAVESFGVRVALPVLHEPVRWDIEWTVRKWDADATSWLAGRLGREPVAADFEAAHIDPYEVGWVEGNLLTTAGLTRLMALLIGAGGQALTNTSGRMGVGNGVGTGAIGDTDLSAAAGAANRQFAVFDATFPTQSAGTINVQSTFAGGVANFAWNEFGIDIGTPTVTAGTTVNATLLNHKTSIAQGTKTSGQTWTGAAAITIS
jgi:hypothetical protein